MRSIYISLLPFVVFSTILFYCWYQLLSNGYIPDIKHIIALILVGINIVIYFIDKIKGIAVTGIILFAASFSLIAINVEIVTNSFFIKIGSTKIGFPAIDYISFLLFLLYCVINYNVVKKGIKYIFKWF